MGKCYVRSENLSGYHHSMQAVGELNAGDIYEFELDGRKVRHTAAEWMELDQVKVQLAELRIATERQAVSARCEVAEVRNRAEYEEDKLLSRIADLDQTVQDLEAKIQMLRSTSLLAETNARLERDRLRRELDAAVLKQEAILIHCTGGNLRKMRQIQVKLKGDGDG